MNSIFFTLLLGTSLYAQSKPVELPKDSVKSKEIKEVTVLGEFTKALTFPMIVVNSSELQSSSFFTPADALQREAGISIARDGIWSTSINVRGFSEQRILEMVDGDRIQTATEHSGPMSTIDMNTIEKIEVIKGASSVLYGTGAIGGVVNFVTKTPAYSEFFQTKGNIGTEFNTVNNLWANFANVQFTTNQWYIGLNGSFRTAQNTMTPGGILPNSQFHDASWGVKAGIMYSPNQEFKANYQHFEGWDIGIPGGRSFQDSAVARYIGVARNQLAGEYIITDINENLQKIRIKAYTQNISRDVEMKHITNPITHLIDPSLTILPGSLNKTSGVKVITDWDFENKQHLILGAEGWERDAQTLRLTEKNSADTLRTVTGDLPTPNAKMYDAGVFAHYSWKIVPAKWTLDAGLRIDYVQTVNDTAFSPLFKYTVKQNVRADVNNLARRVMFVASSHEDIAYAAHVDLVYYPAINQQLNLSLSNSYRVASIEERFKLIELAGPKHVGNPDLKPEKGTFSNLSYTFLSDNWRIKADIFANYLMDLITEKQGTYTYIDATGKTVSESAFLNVNVSKALFLGAELDGMWQINKQFSLIANASYTRATDVDGNTYLPQIPPLHGFASINYDNKKIGAAFSTLWATKQNEIAAGETATDGHIIFNVDAHSQNIKLNNTQLQLFAGVDNLLNAAYVDHLSSTRGDLKLESGRNIYLKVKWGW